MTDVPFVDCSLALDITNVVDNTIQGDTMHRYVEQTTQKVAGTISGEVSHSNMDWIFQGMFYNQFNAANTLTTGVSQNTFSIEAQSPDIGVYFLYKGCVVDKLALTLAPAGIVTYKADFIGASSSAANATVATAVANAAQTPPMTVVNATIKEGGNVVAYISGSTFSFDRKHTVNYALGNANPVSISTSFFDVTGTLDVFLEDLVMYNKFVNSANSSLDYTLTDGTNTYELVFPNIEYTAAGKDMKGTGPIMLKQNFTGVFDATTNTNAKIVRSGP
jgi:Phage tail tube protein